MKRNWAGNLEFGAAQVYWPESVEQLCAIIKEARHVRVFGARHSFSAIADTVGTHVSLERMPAQVAINRTHSAALVSAGMRYGDVCRALNAEGFALPNMASLPQITLAGAFNTATHGSGDGNRVLAACVTGVELVTADGSLQTLSRERHGADFDGMVVSLGALGVALRYTLDLQPDYQVRQAVYRDLPIAAIYDGFDAVSSAAYSVSLFTTWRQDTIEELWIKDRLGSNAAAALPETLFGAQRVHKPLHPIPELAPDSCTDQTGVPGPWCDRLTHFRPEFATDSGAELQSEYFIAREHAPAAFRAMRALGDVFAPALMISEVRTVAADTFWMSGAYQRDTVGLHCTWHPDWPAVRQILPQIERALAPFEPRPHWGKLSTIPGALVQSRYARLPEFLRLRKAMDPDGKFGNRFLQEMTGA